MLRYRHRQAGLGVCAAVTMLLANAPLVAQAAVRQSMPLEVLHGVYVDGTLQGSYMVLNQTLEATAAHPELQGLSENLGAGIDLRLAVGYDLTPLVAAELVGGVGYNAGTREDRVRDFSLAMAGAGLRLAYPVAPRWRARGRLAVGGSWSHNGFASKSGLFVTVAGGIDWLLYLRHFAIGLELAFTAVDVASFEQVLVSLGPSLKYTF